MSHRHWNGRRQIEQLPLPELALSHLSQILVQKWMTSQVKFNYESHT